VIINSSKGTCCNIQKVEAAGASKMFITTYQTAQWHKPNLHHHENLKSHIKPTAIIDGLQ
jgi:hypothetical protein